MIYSSLTVLFRKYFFIQHIRVKKFLDRVTQYYKLDRVKIGILIPYSVFHLKHMKRRRVEGLHDRVIHKYENNLFFTLGSKTSLVLVGLNSEY